MYWIRFHGRKYLLIGELETGGAIATVHQYQNGLCSHASLSPDGQIKRFNKQLGNREDIELIGVANIPCPDIPAALDNMMSHPSWLGDE